MLVRLPGLDEQTRAADTLRPVLGENYVVALNLASTVPPWLEALRARPMLLGLDLQGGVHFLLQVDQKAALEKRLDAYAEDIRVALREARVAYESVERQGIDGTIVATLGEGKSEEHTSELQSLMRISYAVFCLKKKNRNKSTPMYNL